MVVYTMKGVQEFSVEMEGDLTIIQSRLAALARKLAEQTEPLSAAEAQELFQLLVEQYRGKISDAYVRSWQAAMLL